MKFCTKCKLEKEFTEFGIVKTGSDRLRCYCKKCNNELIAEYRKNNEDRIKQSKKNYRLKNVDKVKVYRNKYKNNKRNTDFFYKLKYNTSNLIRLSIAKKGYTKKSKTFEILGCSYEEFKVHIENQFIKGMSWDNRSEWHLDHIYPVSLAKDEEHLLKLNHYTNFQPLWAEDNIRKGNKINN